MDRLIARPPNNTPGIYVLFCFTLCVCPSKRSAYTMQYNKWLALLELICAMEYTQHVLLLLGEWGVPYFRHPRWGSVLFDRKCQWIARRISHKYGKILDRPEWRSTQSHAQIIGTPHCSQEKFDFDRRRSAPLSHGIPMRMELRQRVPGWTEWGSILWAYAAINFSSHSS